MNLTERVAYLKGLMDGMSLPADDNTTKLFRALIEALDEMAVSLSDLEDEVAEVENAVDELDEDLAELEDTVYEGCDCDEDDYFEVECPVCGEVFYIDEETADKGETTCPVCEAEIEVEIDDSDEDDEDEDDD